MPAPSTAEATGPAVTGARTGPAASVLAGGSFLVGANIVLVPPLLAFMTDDLHVSSVVRAALLAALPVGSFLGNLLLGPLIDHMGGRRAFCTGAAGLAVLLCATAAMPNGPSATAVRAVTGFAMPLVGVSSFISLRDVAGEARQAHLVGVLSAGGSLATLLTAPAVVMIAGHSSWRWAFACCGALAALLALGGLVTLPRRPPTGQVRPALRVLTPPRQPEIRTWTALFCLCTFAQVAVVSMYPTWMLHRLGGGDDAVGSLSVLFLISGAVMVVGSITSGTAARRLPQGPTFAVVLAAQVVAVLAVPLFAATYGGQAVLYALVVGMQALTMPMIRTRANQASRADQVAVTNATLNTGYQSATAVAGVLSATAYTFDTSFWTNVSLAALAYLTALFLLHASRSRIPTARPDEQI